MTKTMHNLHRHHRFQVPHYIQHYLFQAPQLNRLAPQILSLQQEVQDQEQRLPGSLKLSRIYDEVAFKKFGQTVKKRRRGGSGNEDDNVNPKHVELEHDTYLTGNAASKGEVNIWHLSPADLFSMHPWQKNGLHGSALELWRSSLKSKWRTCLTTLQSSGPANCTPTRTNAAMSKGTGKTKQQIEKEFPFEAKSRMVVQGNQEDETGIRSDSPTASLLAFNLICAISVMMDWKLLARDASTAYLQSQGISRLLILRPPKPPPPGSTSCEQKGPSTAPEMLAAHGGRSSSRLSSTTAGSCPASSRPSSTCS